MVDLKTDRRKTEARALLHLQPCAPLLAILSSFHTMTELSAETEATFPKQNLYEKTNSIKQHAVPSDWKETSLFFSVERIK